LSIDEIENGKIPLGQNSFFLSGDSVRIPMIFLRKNPCHPIIPFGKRGDDVDSLV